MRKDMDKNQKKQTVVASQAQSLGNITWERIRKWKLGIVQQALENEEMMTGEGCPEFLLFCGAEYGST